MPATDSPLTETRRWAMAEMGCFSMKAGVGWGVGVCRAAGVRVLFCAGRRLRVMGTLSPCSPGWGDSDTRADLGGTSEILWFALSLPLPPQPHCTDVETEARREAGAVQAHTVGQSRVLSLRRCVGLLSPGGAGGGGHGGLAREVEDGEPAEDEDT